MGGPIKAAPKKSPCKCPPPLPAPPGWEWKERDLSSSPKTGSAPANRAIETTYRNKYSSNDVLSDMLFERGSSMADQMLKLTRDEIWRGIQKRQWGTRLPRGAKERKFADYFLERYYGVSQPLRPDIIDFTRRVIYEIKTRHYISAGYQQLADDYKLAQEISDEYDREFPDEGPHKWVQGTAIWKPPHIISIQQGQVVCTGLTDHSGEEHTRGLIIYRVYELKKKNEEERKRNINQVAVPETKEDTEAKKTPKIVNMHPQLQIGDYEEQQKFIVMLQKEIDLKVAPAPVGTEFVIISEQGIYIEFVGKYIMQNTINNLQVRAMDPKYNPVIGLRNLTLAVIISAEAAYLTIALCVFSSVAIAGTSTAATTTAAATAVEGATSVGIAVEATTAAKAAQIIILHPATKITAKAAGVLLVMGLAKNAEADKPEVIHEQMLIVPKDQVQSDGSAEGVTYQGKKFYVIGTARS
ncbi:MAG: hypothetical protein GX639_09150 [Fibrobacter sp.]|mgnify:CR=1 FL=1|nr:hypothetical protein [Fibrobacter sp.]